MLRHYRQIAKNKIPDKDPYLSNLIVGYEKNKKEHGVCNSNKTFTDLNSL